MNGDGVLTQIHVGAVRATDVDVQLRLMLGQIQLAIEFRVQEDDIHRLSPARDRKVDETGKSDDVHNQFDHCTSLDEAELSTPRPRSVAAPRATNPLQLIGALRTGSSPASRASCECRSASAPPAPCGTPRGTPTSTRRVAGSSTPQSPAPPDGTPAA